MIKTEQFLIRQAVSEYLSNQKYLRKRMQERPYLFSKSQDEDMANNIALAYGILDKLDRCNIVYEERR